MFISCPGNKPKMPIQASHHLGFLPNLCFHARTGLAACRARSVAWHGMALQKQLGALTQAWHTVYSKYVLYITSLSHYLYVVPEMTLLQRYLAAYPFLHT